MSVGGHIKGFILMSISDFITHNLVIRTNNPVRDLKMAQFVHFMLVHLVKEALHKFYV